MKILQLDIEGFRSLKKVGWGPGDLNVIIGPNASGKSNLLRFLELISKAAQGTLGKYVQGLGGMQSLVWDGKAKQIRFRIKTSPIEHSRSVEKDSLTYELVMARLGETSSFVIQHEMLGNFYRFDMGDKPEPLKFLERDKFHAAIFDERQTKLVAPPESVKEEEALLSLATSPFSGNRIVTLFQEQIASWGIYHDLHVNLDAEIRKPFVTRNERKVDPDGQNAMSVLHTLYAADRNFKRNINEAMKAAFGDDFEELIFPPAADQRTQLRLRWKSLNLEQSAADLSDGTIRFLFLLTVLASPDSPPVIAIDEPENGLHPSMLPIVAEYAVDAARKRQIIFSTHSPQFLDAFNELKPVVTVTRWQDGQTELHTLHGDDLSYWLREYSLGSLMKTGELEQLQ